MRQVSLRTWVKLAVWFALMLVCRRYRLGQPFVITTLIVLMLTNLGERKAGEASAYTVFNAGMQALPGSTATWQWTRRRRRRRRRRPLKKSSQCAARVQRPARSALRTLQRCFLPLMTPLITVAREAFRRG